MKPSRAILSAGNFWNLQDVYEHQIGILYTQVGYTGGLLPNPNYQDVISGKSGHVEAVEITYNPKETDYEKIIDTFFNSHKAISNNNNNSLHSIIFYLSKEQQNIAEKILNKHQKKSKQKIITEIRPASFFYPAELHHQHYLIKPGQTSCCLTQEC